MSFLRYLVKKRLLSKINFLTVVFSYAIIALSGLFLLSIAVWLPPGFTLAGHDSGLPLNAKRFILSRLYAWDDRLGFGLDNSANFGSLTIHFFDFVLSIIGGTPYAGNYVSLFFWLGLIFLSALIFAYQLKNVCGRPFVFILPIFLTFNFYIFQSVFMLERAKFGIFSATLLALAVFFRMRDGRFSVITAAVITSLVFSIFNGGGWFGITLYGGVAIILTVLVLTDLISGFLKGNFYKFKRTLLLVLLTTIFYSFLNTYSILAYLQNFLSSDAPRLLQESSSEGHIDWLRYVSRASSLINLFRFFGVPDWYGEINDVSPVNLIHPYASFYLNNVIFAALSFIFPVLSFSSFLLAKTAKQRQILSIFGLIALIEVISAAGSNSPFGFFYEFLMNNVPGFFIFRSAFYKFGIFYMLGMVVLFSFTISLLIIKLTDRILDLNNWFRKVFISSLILSVICLWLGYHYVLFDPVKVFSWNSGQSTKMQIPGYVYDFDNYVEKNNFNDKRVLILPPVNKDWENDAYDWGYWSLSPLPFTFSSVRTLSNWHGLNSEELILVENLYNAIQSNDEKGFSELANNLNVGYVLIRHDVLTDSKWSSSEKPDNYKNIIETFEGIGPQVKFGKWELYPFKSTSPMQIYTVSNVNLTADNFVSLVNRFFTSERTVGFSDKKKYPDIDNLSLNKVYAYDCLSCLLEKQVRLKSLPETVVLPGSLFYRFKEAREKKVLNSSEDSRSKIANYLGYILTRSAEHKKMLDLFAKEERLLSNLAVIRSYLSIIYSELESSKEYASDFELLSQILDFLNPVEREISDSLKTNNSKVRSHRFDEGMLGILWDIGRIKDYFVPLLENRERWAKEKVYKLTFPEAGNYSLAFSSSVFPRSIEDKIILPKQIKFLKGTDEKLLILSEEKVNWLSAELGFQESGDGKLILYFDEPPNLFETEETESEKFPYGRVSCLNGHIKNFDRKRAYEILISKTDRLRNVTAILRDKNRSYSQQHGFLKGEDLFEVPAVAHGEFSRYVYFPSSYAKDISLYICSDDKIVPSIDKLIIREFFSPSALIIRKSDLIYQEPPGLSYFRINPTSYTGEVEASGNPFVLIFNEKINNLWRLSILNSSGSWNVVNKHFMIDGYINGWLIEKGNVRKFKIEYTPQLWFYLGAVISVSALILCISWLIYSSVKFKKNDKDEHY